MKHKELSNHERKCQYFSKIKTVQNHIHILLHFQVTSSLDFGKFFCFTNMIKR